MIASIKGNVIAVENEGLVVDVNNIGIRVLAPLGRMQGEYALNREIFLYTHFVVREDQWVLFGFLTEEELGVFKQIINVSGIGGKSALAVLNTLSPGEVAAAVSAGDAGPFQRVSGIGKKTAQRIVLELKDKLSGIMPTAQGEAPVVIPDTAADNDAVSALVSLGYTKGDAQKTVLAVLREEPLIDSEALLRKALLKIGKY